jgi:hypothetical protein
MSDYILFKNLDHNYLSLKECVEKNKAEGVEDTTIYYVTDEQQQSQYINMFKEAGMDAVDTILLAVSSSLSTRAKKRFSKLYGTTWLFRLILNFRILPLASFWNFRISCSMNRSGFSKTA